MKNFLPTLSLTVAYFISGCGGGSSGPSALQFQSPDNLQITENSNKSIQIETNRDKDITFSIVSGPDANLFQIDSTTGQIHFKTTPDFENPADADKNNVYEILVEATDAKGEKTQQRFFITVTNDSTDDGPSFTSANATSLVENSKLDFDIVANGAVRFSVEGIDQKFFQIDNNNKLAFNKYFTPDYEHPSDSDEDNKYMINIMATDDQNHTSKQHFTLQITNDPVDDEAEAQWIPIYKTGADDGPEKGLAFGDRREFTADESSGQRVIKVGKRVWQDSPDDKQAKYDFDGAEEYCAQLNYAGKDDWRVPNRHEYYEIINYGKSASGNPTIDDIFQNAIAANYWTSQNVVDEGGNILTNEAFSVSFQDGASYSTKRDQKFAVRCVSGPELTFTEEIERNSDDTYHDSKTGLQWGEVKENISYYDAVAFCKESVFAGYHDWRLPNISELHTIMPTYDLKFLLVDQGAGPFWASTKLNDTHGRYIENYWNREEWGDGSAGSIGLDVLNDDTEKYDVTDTSGAICVRGGHL